MAISLCPVLNAMLLSIERVWSCTAHVLCNDAPEGFVSDEAHDEHVISTKDVSSYSWRSVKEAR